MKLVRTLLVAGSFAPALLTAANPAADLADNATYTTPSPSWTAGQNGGFGFGPWALAQNGAGGFAGFFAGSSDLNSPTQSWGTFANGTGFNEAVAFRAFTGGSLSVGQTFSVQFDHGAVNNGSTGVILRTGNVNGSAFDYNNGARFEFLALSGQRNYQLVDSGGLVDTGIALTTSGLTLNFTLTSLDAYNLVVRDAANTTPFGTFDRTLGGTAGAGLDSFALYNRNTDGGDVFFNNLQVVPEPSTYALLGGLIALGLAALRRRRA